MKPAADRTTAKKMSPGSNKRQTGTVPKTKAARKNVVPQEVVAPTPRDLQQHLNVSLSSFVTDILHVFQQQNICRSPFNGKTA